MQVAYKCWEIQESLRILLFQSIPIQINGNIMLFYRRLFHDLKLNLENLKHKKKEW